MLGNTIGRINRNGGGGPPTMAGLPPQLRALLGGAGGGQPKLHPPGPQLPLRQASPGPAIVSQAKSPPPNPPVEKPILGDERKMSDVEEKLAKLTMSIALTLLENFKNEEATRQGLQVGTERNYTPTPSAGPPSKPSGPAGLPQPGLAKPGLPKPGGLPLPPGMASRGGIIPPPMPIAGPGGRGPMI